MNTTQMRRLQALEQAAQASKGMLVAQQDLDDPNLYRGAGDATYTSDELHQLSERGYQVIRLDWDSNWRSPYPNEKRVKLTWGDLAERYQPEDEPDSE